MHYDGSRKGRKYNNQRMPHVEICQGGKFEASLRILLSSRINHLTSVTKVTRDEEGLQKHNNQHSNLMEVLFELRWSQTT